MEPIGTITMYFPFIDSETRETLQTIMNQVKNYREFVQVLNQKVCDEDSTELVVFFATHHAAVLHDFNFLDRIAQRYGQLNLIRPNLFIAGAFQGRQEDLEKARAATDIVLAEETSKWIIMEMHASKLEAEIYGYPTKIYDDNTLNDIQNLLKENQELDFIESRVYHALAVQAIKMGDTDTAFDYLEKAITNAQRFDELNRLARLYRTKSQLLQQRDLIIALELLMKSAEMLEIMDDKLGLCDTLFQKSKIEAIRGQFDQAIETNLYNTTLRQGVGSPIGALALTLSTLYNMTNNPEAGLEWAKMAEVEMNPIHRPRAILNQAWSFHLQGKITEGDYLIDDVRDSIFKSGIESLLAGFYLISGVQEMVKGNFSESSVSFEEALDIYERVGALMSCNICLYYLSRIEVATSDIASTTEDNIGPWLNLMEQRGVSDHLPGILGQALLLKAELFIIQNRQQEADGVIAKLSSIIDEHRLEYLQDKLDSLIKEI